MTRLAGGCHCTAVRFSVEVEDPVTLIECNCSICSATGFLHLIVPEEQFGLEAGADMLISYRFNTGTADHLFCKRCGIKSFYRPRSHPDGWSVNWRCIDSAHAIVPIVEPYDGRQWEAARARLDG